MTKDLALQDSFVALAFCINYKLNIRYLMSCPMFRFMVILFHSLLCSYSPKLTNIYSFVLFFNLLVKIWLSVLFTVMSYFAKVSGRISLDFVAIFKRLLLPIFSVMQS